MGSILAGFCLACRADTYSQHFAGAPGPCCGCFVVFLLATFNDAQTVLHRERFLL